MHGLGFAGGICLAAAAWLAGALPSGDPAGLTAGYLAGLVCWVAGGAALSVAWIRSAASPAGKALWALPVVVSPPLGSRDIYAYACQGWLWWHDLDPYRTGVAEGGCPWTPSVPQLWWDTPAPYGPLAIVLSGLAAATGSQLGAMIVLRATAVGAAVLLAWQLPRLIDPFADGGVASPAATPRDASPRRSGPWGGRAGVVGLGVVTPLVMVHGISGAHNDMLVAAGIVAALVAGRRRRPLLAGLCLAAAVAVKVTALVAAPFVLLLLAAPGKRDDLEVTPTRDSPWRGPLDVGRVIAAARGSHWDSGTSISWALAVLSGLSGFTVLSLAAGLDLGWLNALRHTGALVQWSSLPTAVGMAFGYLVGPQAVTVARVIGLIVLAGLALYALRVARRGRVIVACGGLLAATALLGPVFYPWYLIAALAVLAVTGVPRRWLVAATLVCAFLALPNGHGIPAQTKAVGAYVVTAALIGMAVHFVRSRVRARKPPPRGD